jgi:hypothetical protein
MKDAAADVARMLMRREGFNPYDNASFWEWVRKVA